MATARRPAIRAVTAVIRDGSKVRIRAIRSDDARHADAFFQWLSEETKYLRFMYLVKELTPEIMAGVFTQEGLQRVVLVAEPADLVGDEPTPAVAIGRYAPSPDLAACEVAITVGDTWQGRGVGSALLRRLIVLARRAGYRKMLATALTANTKMTRLARAFGFDIDVEPDGVTAMTLRLAPVATSRSAKKKGAKRTDAGGRRAAQKTPPR
jgi:acetyltransferase